MKQKDLMISITFCGFIGFLWLFFIYLILRLNILIENRLIISGTIIILGTILLFEIVRRISPFVEYKNSIRLKIAGFISFSAAVVISSIVVIFLNI